MALVVVGLAVAGCSGGSAAVRHERPTTTTPPSSTTSTAVAPTTTIPVEPTSTQAPGSPSAFPALVVQAMDQFVPLPPGAEAPVHLPSTSGYLTAQTGGLGGQDNVTLIAVSQPLPVNSPALSSAGEGEEVASFSTTPTASSSNAAAALAQAKSQSIDSCQGPSQTVTLPGGTSASSCPTIDGAALDWGTDGWEVQVLTLSGTNPSTAEAGQVQSELASTGLPEGGAGGIVSVVVPGSTSAGSSDTAALEWVVGSDLYEVRSSSSPASAFEVAASMRPYPS